MSRITYQVIVETGSKENALKLMRALDEGYDSKNYRFEYSTDLIRKDTRQRQGNK